MDQQFSSEDIVPLNTNLDDRSLGHYAEGGEKTGRRIFLYADDWKLESCFQLRMRHIGFIKTQTLK